MLIESCVFEENYESILSIVYQYLDLLRSTPPLHWSWDESSRLGQIAWRFKEKGQPQSTARNLASQLSTSRYPPSKLLVGPWFASEWNEQEIRDVMDCVRPEKGRVLIGSKDPIEGREFWKEKEKVSRLSYPLFTSTDTSVPLSGTVPSTISPSSTSASCRNQSILHQTSHFPNPTSSFLRSSTSSQLNLSQILQSVLSSLISQRLLGSSSRKTILGPSLEEASISSSERELHLYTRS